MEQLNRIQKELKAPKNQRNTFGNYNYRSAEDILEAVKPLLGESILTLSDDIVSEGGRVYVRATATLRDGVGNQVSVTAFAREPESKKGMDESQITGAASSYARKYALNGLFAIDDTKDADATNQHKTRPTAQQWDKIIERLKSGRDVNATINATINTFELTEEQIKTLKQWKQQ